MSVISRKMSNHVSFPAKLLLFGEYAVLFGGNAFSIPIFKYYGNLAFSQKNDKNAIKSNKVLKRFSHYLIKLINSNSFLNNFDFIEFRKEIDAGLYFNSNIPRSYGLGSSGALCAAIYSHYFHSQELLDLAIIKNQLALFENYFHKSSSGFDPLVSFIQKPIFLKKSTIPDIIEFNTFIKSLDIYLLDSHVRGKTKDSMNNFLNKLNNVAFQNNTFNKFIELTNLCIDTLLKPNSNYFYQYLFELSHLQFNEFGELIPNHIKDLWYQGLKSRNFCLKLCGSGGGGFFIFFNNSDSTPEELSKRLIKVFI